MNNLQTSVKMSATPYIAGLTNKNIFLIDFKEPYEEKSLRDETTTNIRNIVFSPKGTYLAYRTDKKVEIVRCSDWSVTATIPGNVKDMFFSPLDNYFTLWEMFLITKENPQGKHNLHVFKSANGELAGSFTQKTQTGWEPRWSSDEKLFALQINSRVLVYEDNEFGNYVQQLKDDKLKSFSLSPSPAPSYYLTTFTLGKQGQPSFWRIYKYPQLTENDIVLSRSSFQADKATFYWNKRGTNVFTMTQTDVDKTGGSYYGKQSLSYGDIKGSSGNVAFSKEGPIHAISWNPGNSNEWVAVYGHAPAKATIFNIKCEPLFEFGTGPWNSIYFPPEGNRMLIAGFGNIASGHIEAWDLRGYKKIGSCAAPDTTSLHWDPRGEAFITATTYPRLTVGNGSDSEGQYFENEVLTSLTQPKNKKPSSKTTKRKQQQHSLDSGDEISYKIWHYTCALMHKRVCQEKENLLSIIWQPGTFSKSDLSKVAPKGIEDSTPKAAAAYRPPGAKNRPSTFKLHDEEKPHKPGETPSAPSKQAIKQKEKREARKARKAEEKAQGDASTPPPEATSSTPKAPFVSTGDPEKDKKIKNLNKKLSDIDKLKQQKAAGKQLELNQLAKIESEPALLQELAQLKL